MTQPPEPPPIRVITGSPTDEETAAIAALFSRLRWEQEVSPLPLPGGPGQSAWARSIRPLRPSSGQTRRWGDL